MSISSGETPVGPSPPQRVSIDGTVLECWVVGCARWELSAGELSPPWLCREHPPRSAAEHR